MDPNMFRIDWDVLAEVLVTIVVLSFLIERALAIVTENRLFVNSPLDDSGVKEMLSFALSWIVVAWVNFDALAILFKLDATRWPGLLITAGILAGGSKASLKLFHDVMDLKSSARRQKDEVKKVLRKKQLEDAAHGVAIAKVI